MEPLREIRAPNSPVRFTGNEQLAGRVLEIKINELGQTYHVAWWDGGVYRTDWFYPAELVDAEGSATQTIGFKR